MTTKTITEFKNSLLNKAVLGLVEDALKPMSILEIQEKFNLSFPFKVKRVVANQDNPVDFPVGEVYVICSIKDREIKGQWIKVTQNTTSYVDKVSLKKKGSFQSAEMQHYTLVE